MLGGCWGVAPVFEVLHRKLHPSRLYIGKLYRVSASFTAATLLICPIRLHTVHAVPNPRPREQIQVTTLPAVANLLMVGKGRYASYTENTNAESYRV